MTMFMVLSTRKVIVAMRNIRGLDERRTDAPSAELAAFRPETITLINLETISVTMTMTMIIVTVINVICNHC